MYVEQHIVYRLQWPPPPALLDVTIVIVYCPEYVLKTSRPFDRTGPWPTN